MFIGHIAVGLAAKKAAPRTSLGTLLMAAQFTDLLWPILLLLGVEQVAIVPGSTVVTPLAFLSYPISHSLLADIGWATLFAGGYQILKDYSRGALWVGIAVLSHWFLDALSHRPDLPLYPGSRTLIGLGLWNSLAGTIVVEGLLFGAGVLFYLKTTRAKDRTGAYAFWSLIALLVLLYLGNLFGPIPPNVTSIAILGLLGWLLVPWGYWIDRHREVKSLQIELRNFP